MSHRPLVWLAVFASGCASVEPSRVPSSAADTSQVPERSTEVVERQAALDFDAGRLAEAQQAYGELARRAPNNATVQFDLGLIAEQQGRPAEAVERYEAARAIDPRHRPTLLNLGRAYSAAGRAEAAVALYEEVLKDAGPEGDLEFATNLSATYRLSKRLDEAEIAARRVLARARDNPRAYQTLALVAYDQGQLRKAELLATHAQGLDARDPGPANTLGLVALARGELQAALGHFRRAVALDEKCAAAWANLAAMALTYRDYAGAERALVKLVELEPTSVDSLLSLGWALTGQQRTQPRKGEEAGRVFERVLAIDPGQPDALCGAAWAFSGERASWEKSLGYFERCRASPTTSEADRAAIETKVKGIRALRQAAPVPPSPPREVGGSDSP